MTIHSAPEQHRGIDIGHQVLLDGIPDIGRVFRHIDRRRGMEAEMDPAPLAARAQRRGPALVDRAERVRAGVELDIDKPHRMRRCPGHRVFQRQLAPDIDADALAQTHHQPPARDDPAYHPIRPTATAPQSRPWGVCRSGCTPCCNRIRFPGIPCA